MTMTTARSERPRRKGAALPNYVKHGPIAQLRLVRLMRGLRTADLEDIVGVGRNQIGRWERGENDPGLSNLEAWANALGYTVELKLTRRLDT